MAEKLLRLYKFVQDSAGPHAKVQVAMASKMPSSRAALEPDTPENIRSLSAAIKSVLGKDPPSV
jgi:hypothetical protein